MKKLIILSPLLLVVIFLSGCTKTQTNQNQPISSIPAPKADQSAEKEQTPFPNPKKVIAPSNNALYYQLNDTNNSVDVYLLSLSEDGTDNSKKIINNVPIGSASGIMPEFIGPFKSDIVSLTIGDADGGGSFANYYYINLTPQGVGVVTVKSRILNNMPELEVIDSQKVESKIGINIENKCSYDIKNGIGCKNLGQASLSDLTLNGKNIRVIKNPKVLSCYDPGGLGGCYKESLSLQYKGITENLEKIFFSFIGEDQNGKILWHEDYSFNVKNQLIKEEEVKDLLK